MAKEIFEQIDEGLREALAVARGESEPLNVRKPGTKMRKNISESDKAR